LDLSAAFFDSILIVLGVVMADLTWRIGQKTGFLQYWRYVTAGFVFIALSRVILVTAELTTIWFTSEWGLRDIGLIGVIVSTILMLIGIRGLLKAVDRAEKHGD
jgi:hypothetical protein